MTALESINHRISAMQSAPMKAGGTRLGIRHVTQPKARLIRRVQRGPDRGGPVRLAISANDRKAALTACPFGKKSASSGSITTTFELFLSRLMYFPRTNDGKSERLYSARSSSGASFLAFFINLSLCPSCLARRDDSNSLSILCCRKRIEEYAGSFIEGYAVLT